MPIYQTHTFAFDSAESMAAAFTEPDGAYIYGRLGNPTIRALEMAVADLEGGAAALAAGSGMGSITSTLWALLRAGDHVVAQRCLYGGTLSLLADLEDRWGIEVTLVTGDDPGEVRAALRPTTRVLLLETIANPTGQVVDLPALLAIARAAGVTGIVDNTFATPLVCRPIEHGADVVVHSATKFLGGHSDVLGGLAVFADPGMHHAVRGRSVDFGAALDPFAAWLTIRGLQTLALRVRTQCDNAQLLAERLAAHPAVAVVHYPGLDSHPGHATARRVLAGGFGGVLSFELKGGMAAGAAFAGALRLAVLSPSLGDVKTLVMHPASSSHRQLDAHALAAAGIEPGLIRVSAGIEHVEDLWTDFAQALAAATG
jgi:methionine-gamma-lyase